MIRTCQCEGVILNENKWNKYNENLLKYLKAKYEKIRFNDDTAYAAITFEILNLLWTDLCNFVILEN